MPRVSEELPEVFRLHSATGSGDREATFQYMLDKRLIGVGWGCPETLVGRHINWPTYQVHAIKKFGRVSPPTRAMHDAPRGALVWLRDARGTYHLARIDGRWRYLTARAAANVDIFNARPATIRSVGLESRVPGKVANAFIAGSAFRHIPDAAARRYTLSVWEKLEGRPSSFHPTYDDVLKTLLGSQDLEDLVAVYLQREKGYLVLPASRRPDTPAYEYVLRHPDGHEAVVQVKTGDSPVPRDAQSLPVAHTDVVYVFSPTNTYSGRRAKNVRELDFDALVRFMREQPRSLPPLVEHWTKLVTKR